MLCSTELLLRPAQGFLRWGWQAGCGFVDSECASDAPATANPFCQASRKSESSLQAALRLTQSAVNEGSIKEAVDVDFAGSQCSEDRHSIGFCTVNFAVDDDNEPELCGRVKQFYSCTDPQFDALLEEFDEIPNGGNRAPSSFFLLKSVSTTSRRHLET